MDTGNFIVYIKTHDIYKDIAEAVETRSNTSNCELNKQTTTERKKQESYWCNER